jgi:hypothetical protein
MTQIDRTPQKLVLQSGSTTLVLDKDVGKATMQRKLLFWSLKPIERSLGEVADVTVDAGVDRASGIDVCNVMLISRSGEGLALPAADKKDAQATAEAMRDFLGLRPH